ncbi:MAG: heavy metal sensor histidine kinase [Hydrogenophaga sp.]|uniref:heavy metal sensor histidine kinase n=1 Tax=Hydrogenophaga sp. TaxID=1904254 RepID=UPI001DD7EC76|nr:heavy metal sensor histidine kinase [Hydrogenophaga sp.]MBX3608677.1 heavy metal sensor histidine kinase [Hydrogenophaga sp.]
MSLTARLTILFAGVVALVLAGFSTLVLRETSAHFVELDRSLLMSKVHLVEEAVQASQTEDDLRRQLATSTHGHDGLYLRVSGSSGVLLEQGDFIVPGVVLEGLETSSQGLSWYDANGSLYAQRFELNLVGNAPGQISVTAAVDTSHHRHFLDDLTRKIAVYALIAVLAGTLLGWMASRGGLKPLTAMKARAERLSAQRLGERMPAESVPREMRELALSLNDMLNRLQADFERLSTFSSDLAHEMRTPVSNLLTAAQVTLAQQRTPQDYRSSLATISEELQRLARTISDMLLLAKTENLHELPLREAVNLVTEARSIVEFYEAVASDKNLAIGVDGEGEVSGDRLMIRRAISNLLSNAVRHADKHTTVSIVVSPSESGVTLSVSNRGSQIPVASHQQLFDRFVRLSPGRSRDVSEGVGLGLPITKAIMHAHHGEVTVRSADGVNTFALEFVTR